MRTMILWKVGAPFGILSSHSTVRITETTECSNPSQNRELSTLILGSLLGELSNNFHLFSVSCYGLASLELTMEHKLASDSQWLSCFNLPTTSRN